MLIVIAASGSPAFAQNVYEGVADASAAIAIDKAHFLVAEDEGEVLRLYRNDKPKNKPIGRGFNFAPELRADAERECDIEGAARAGDRVYWITSHGRNSNGKRRANRYRLFATGIEGAPPGLKVTWIGRYDNLVGDMLRAELWSTTDVAHVERTIKLIAGATKLHKPTDRELAPTKSGLNIEALAAFPDGSGLLIGLRNPISGGEALVIHLKNPDDLVRKSKAGAVARFGEAFYLDLQGLGLRSMAYSSRIKAFLIVAGPSGKGGPFKLFKWHGTQDDAPVMITKLESAQGSSPEALVLYPNSSRIQIIHDEGSKLVGGKKCKDLPYSQRSFSDRWYADKEVEKIAPPEARVEKPENKSPTATRRDHNHP